MYLSEIAKQTDTQMPQAEEEIQLPKQILEQFERTYVDHRAILGQKALNYIMHHQEMYDKFQKGFFHYLIVGEVYSHKGVRRNEPFYEILNPLDIDYDKDPDLEFVEDGDWSIIRKFAHASTIIDNLGMFLTSEQVLELENPTNQSAESYLLFRSEASGADDNLYRNRLIEVVTVYWKSRKRIGFVEYTDQKTGMLEQFEVNEQFKLTPDLKEQNAKIRYEWINEVWEGTKIDGRFFVNINPITNQRTSLDNPSTCKLPVNGRKYSDINADNISLVSLGIPFQLNYNIFKYRMELAIARSKDIIAQFDINMIPKKWDMDKFMYFVEGTGIAWVDYNKEGIQLSPQHQSVLDMSIKTIDQYLGLLESIIQEWEKISGVNRQRQGGIGTYEGKATSQQAIVQSSHITEDIFRKYSRFEQRELQGMIDYSKEAWLSGKKAMYVMPDLTSEIIDIDAVQHMESEYGVFVSDAGRDQDKLDQAKSLAQSMIQNGLPRLQCLIYLIPKIIQVLKIKLKELKMLKKNLKRNSKKHSKNRQHSKLS